MEGCTYASLLLHSASSSAQSSSAASASCWRGPARHPHRRAATSPHPSTSARRIRSRMACSGLMPSQSSATLYFPGPVTISTLAQFRTNSLLQPVMASAIMPASWNSKTAPVCGYVSFLPPACKAFSLPTARLKLRPQSLEERHSKPRSVAVWALLPAHLRVPPQTALRVTYAAAVALPIHLPARRVRISCRWFRAEQLHAPADSARYKALSVAYRMALVTHTV